MFQFKSGTNGVAIVNELTENMRFDNEVIGSHGRITMGRDGVLLWTLKKLDAGIQESAPRMEWYDLEPHAIEAEDKCTPLGIAAAELIEALDTGAALRSTGKDGRAALEMVWPSRIGSAAANARSTFALPRPSTLHAMRVEGFSQRA